MTFFDENNLYTYGGILDFAFDILNWLKMFLGCLHHVTVILLYFLKLKVCITVASKIYWGIKVLKIFTENHLLMKSLTINHLFIFVCIVPNMWYLFERILLLIWIVKQFTWKRWKTYFLLYLTLSLKTLMICISLSALHISFRGNMIHINIFVDFIPP